MFVKVAADVLMHPDERRTRPVRCRFQGLKHEGRNLEAVDLAAVDQHLSIRIVCSLAVRQIASVLAGSRSMRSNAAGGRASTPSSDAISGSEGARPPPPGGASKRSGGSSPFRRAGRPP